MELNRKHSDDDDKSQIKNRSLFQKVKLIINILGARFVKIILMPIKIITFRKLNLIYIVFSQPHNFRTRIRMMVICEKNSSYSSTPFVQTNSLDIPIIQHFFNNNNNTPSVLSTQYKLSTVVTSQEEQIGGQHKNDKVSGPNTKTKANSPAKVIYSVKYYMFRIN